VAKDYISPVKPVFDAFEHMLKTYDRMGEERRKDPKKWGPPAQEDPRLAFQIIVDNLAPPNRSGETYWYARIAHWFTINDPRPASEKSGQLIVQAIPHLFANDKRDGLIAFEFVELSGNDLHFYTRSFKVEPPKAITETPAKFSRSGEGLVTQTLDQLDEHLKAALKWGEHRPIAAFAALVRPAYVCKNALPRFQKIMHPDAVPLAKPAPK